MPKKFLWGAATAAYQIEGAVLEDGRSPSIWDTYTHTPGKTANGETGDVAADHYHRWEEDLDLMSQLGLNAYRFSIAWPRVQPDGSGELNRKGVAFYQRLIDGLNARGIRPMVTLYHWDLPQALEDAGGWPERATAVAFGRYAELISGALHGVDDWFTFNEPWCSSFLGYASGVHAPGRTDQIAALRAMHHINAAHAFATRAIRANQPGARVGAALNLRAAYPADPDSSDDVAAARQIELMGDEVFLGPMLEGAYSPELLRLLDPVLRLEDLASPEDFLGREEKLDFLGVNYYHSVTASRRTPDSPPSATGGHGRSTHSPWIACDDVVIHDCEPPLTPMGWNIDPDGLLHILRRIHARHPDLPLVISENGYAREDEVGPDGKVHDVERIDYLRKHIRMVGLAQKDGIPVEGYLHWSLMDNLEWARGYAKRFGFIHIDYESLVRTPKESARWYSLLAKSEADPQDLLEKELA